MGGPPAHGAVESLVQSPHASRPRARPRRGAPALLCLSIAAIVVALSLNVAGCTNPSAVGRFAAIGKAADESFSSIANDLGESCVRRERYRLLGEWRSDVETLDDEAGRSCAEYARSARRLGAAHRILVRYLAALGELAGGGVVSYDDAIGELAGSLEDADMLGESGAEAARGVGAVLMDAAAGKWRRDRLGSVIEEAHPSVRTLAETLRGIVAGDYVRLLDGESEAARKFYLGKLRDGGEEEPLASVLVYGMWRDEEDALSAKRSAAASYAKVLGRIASGHQDLYESRNKLDSKESRKLVLRHVAAIEELMTEVRRAF